MKISYFYSIVFLSLLSSMLLFNHCEAQSNASDLEKSLDNIESDFDKESLHESIKNAQAAYKIAEVQGDELKMALALQSEAKALLTQPRRVIINRKKAKDRLEESLELFTKLGELDLRLENLHYLKWIADQNKNKRRSEELAIEISDLEKILTSNSNAEELQIKTETLNLQIQTLNEAKLNLDEKVKELNKQQLTSELLIALQKNTLDSLSYKAINDSLIIAEQKAISAEQAKEIELRQNQRYLGAALVALLLFVAIASILRYRSSRKHTNELILKNSQIQEEQEKSDNLLLNILPSSVANELKTKGAAQAKNYERATVFFSDFVNFSRIAKELSPEVLVNLLDEYFKIFDSVISKHKLEKIKTIGDAYMCVGGIPEPNTTHPSDAIKAAIELQNLLNDLKIKKEKLGTPFFQARIGIHTGPLVAGVVGSTKFAYDIWGDTVNVAARLESSSEPGKVNISGSTHELIKNDFNCSSRGKIPIKNLGEIEMFFVD